MSADTVDEVARLLRRSDFNIVDNEVVTTISALTISPIYFDNIRNGILTKHGWTQDEYWTQHVLVEYNIDLKSPGQI